MENKQLIKNLTKLANKAKTKLMASTFCPLERNKGTQLINDALTKAINSI